MATFNCPSCGGVLTEVPGTQMNPKDGITLYCPHRNCPPQDVMGHGDTAKEAFAVIQHKFPNRNKDTSK